MKVDDSVLVVQSLSGRWFVLADILYMEKLLQRLGRTPTLPAVLDALDRFQEFKKALDL